MSIALVGNNSIHCIRYLTAISKVYTQIIFITNDTKDELALPDNVKIYKINFKLLNFKARIQILLILNRHHDITTIHIHQANSYAYHTLKAVKILSWFKHNKKYKIILNVWGSDILILPQKNLLLRQMVKFNLKNSHIVVCGSLFASYSIKRLCPNIANLHIINFGIQNFPQQLDLSLKENIILSNRLHKPLYNIDKIIKAYAKLVHDAKHQDFKLVIAASGIQTKELKILAQKLQLKEQNIIFTGMLSYNELVRWYEKAKIFVSIPDSDSVPSSLFEAMAYGCYPILSNIPISSEFIIDGISGTINKSTDELHTDLSHAINLTASRDYVTDGTGYATDNKGYATDSNNHVTVGNNHITDSNDHMTDSTDYVTDNKGYVSDSSDYLAITEFNRKIIKQKALWEDNIKKYIELYSL